jgi:hypothetical protein
MEASRSSETSVYNKPTRRHIPEDGILYSHRRENLKSYISPFLPTYEYACDNNSINSVAVRERTVPTERPQLVGDVSANFRGRGCHVVSVTDLYDRILGCLYWRRYFLLQVAPKLYSRGWVDPFSDPLLRKSGNTGNRTRASGSVVRNSDD